MNTQTALITGASSGIGYELASLFAKDHYNLVIVSRDEQKLKSVAGELKMLGAGKVTVVARDLSYPGQAESLFEHTEQNGINVDVLVNDAGIGQHGLFVDSPLEKDLEIIHVNIVSLVTLTKLYLRKMKARNSGKILQLASISAYQPTPKLAVYAATKAFVLSFTDSLINELQGTGIGVTALIPGPTETDFFRKADMLQTKAYEKTQEAAVVAKVGYEGLMRGIHHATAPGMNKEILMSSVLPNEAVAAKARSLMEETDEPGKEKKPRRKPNNEK